MRAMAVDKFLFNGHNISHQYMLQKHARDTDAISHYCFCWGESRTVSFSVIISCYINMQVCLISRIYEIKLFFSVKIKFMLNYSKFVKKFSCKKSKGKTRVFNGLKLTSVSYMVETKKLNRY